MTHFRAAVLTIVVALIFAVAVDADEAKTYPCAPPTLVTATVGTFSSDDGNYAAWTICLAKAVRKDGGKATIYYEKDALSPFDLVIARYPFDARGDKAVVRIDGGKTRVGVFAPMSAGFTSQLIAGNGPVRFDLWTPCVPITHIGAAKIGASGWVRIHQDNKPDWWPTVNLNWGPFFASYNYNLRSGGKNFLTTGCSFGF